jgi:hypothetical protein
LIEADQTSIDPEFNLESAGENPTTFYTKYIFKIAP